MKKILCLTDFSKAATNAVEYATLVAEKTGAALTLLHVVHLPLLDTTEAALVAGEVAGDQKRHATEKLHALVRHLSEKHREHPLEIDYQVQEALLVDAVVEMTRRNEFGLVVVGSTGGGNTLEEILVGSNTEAIIEHVHCPVLAVPLKSVPAPFRHIVYASNYEPEDPQALAKALAFAEIFGAELEVVHVSEKASDGTDSRAARFQEELRTALPQYQLAFHEVVHPDEVEGMKGYLTRKHADLLVILKKRRPFFHHLFTQSFSEQLTYQSKLPLLILHP